MSIEIIAVIAGVVITWLIFTWFLKIFRASLKTALTIAIILFCLQMFFGIRYQEVWQEFSKLVQELLMKLLN